MKVTNPKILNTLIVIILLSLSAAYAVYLHRELNGGFIAGGDWPLPATHQQYTKFFSGPMSTWSDSWYLGYRNSVHTNMWFAASIYTLSFFLKDLSLIPILVIVIIQFSAFITMYYFLKENKISVIGSLIAGLFLATSPIFFNYLLMGWIYILFAFSFLSLSLLFIQRGLLKKDASMVMLAGIFFGMSLAQSQAIAWIPLVVVTFILFGKFNELKIKSRILYFFLFFITGVLFNAPTLLEVIATPNTTLFNSKIVRSGSSIGASSNTIPVNILRLMGSGYNNQYENSQKNGLFAITSFLLPIFIILLLFKQNGEQTHLIKCFVPLLFIPLIAYIVSGNREFMAAIPGAAIFRDVSRFTFISTYAAAVLIGIFFDSILRSNGKTKAILLFLFSLWFFVSIAPWISGKLTEQPEKPAKDVRLRAIKYPTDYTVVEEMLQKEDERTRVLYLPAMGTLSLENYADFKGSYHEIQDVYAGYSPLPGMIYISGRDSGLMGQTISKLVTNLKNHNLESLESFLKITSTKYVVVKTSARFDYKEYVLSYLDRLVTNGTAKYYYNGSDIKVYEIQCPHPLIYSPKNDGIYADGNTDITKLDTNIKCDKETAYIPEQFTGYFNEPNNTTITYVKNSPTKYYVKIIQTHGKIPLIFTDSFDEYWEFSHASNGFVKNILLADLSKYSTHFVANNYANGWLLDIDSLCLNEKICNKNPDGSYSLDIILEFFPQKVFNIGIIISILTTITVLTLIVKKGFTK